MPKLKKELDTRGEQVGQERKAIIALEGPARIDRDDIEVVSGPNLGDKAEIESFMAEHITILIHPSVETYPEDPVRVAVNGRTCFIWRNQETLVPRKYVERLARAKRGNVRQDVTAREPEVVNKLHLSSALKYPFSVLNDPNPKGAAWLKKILAEA